MQTLRAQPITFELPDGTTYQVAPPTLEQYRQAIDLELHADETARTPHGMLMMRWKQAEILTGGATWVGSLDRIGLSDVLAAMIAHVHGYNPEDQEQMQEFLKKKAIADLLAKSLSPPSTE